MRGLAAMALAVGAAPAAAVPAGFAQKADATLARGAPDNGPAIVVAVSENGRLVWSGAAGRADIAAGTPAKPTDLFRYASITKQFTAALVLKLVDEGRLSLGDDLGKLLPAETPAAWHKVTVRQLLNHTSGIPSYTSKPGFMEADKTARPITTQQLIDVTRGDPLDFEPGTAFRYNNTGYVLLSAIVEKLTGKPWYHALREKITGPLRLSSIRCGCEPGPAVVASTTNDGKPSQKIDMSVPSGAGALVGTAGDLARWAAALHGGKVLKPASYQAMITPSVPAGAGPAYAFGLYVGDLRGAPTLEHSGGIFGFRTDSIYLPDRNLFVAALSNSDGPAVDVSGIARRLLAEASGNPFPTFAKQTADLSAIAPWFGTYKDQFGERLFYERDGKLWFERVGGDRFEAFSAGNGKFFFGENVLSYFETGRDAAGKPILTFYPDGTVRGQVGTLTGPVPPRAAVAAPSPAELDRLVGSYRFGPAILTIARGGDTGLTGQLTGQQPIALEASGRLEFRTVGVNARLTFEEKEGKIVRVVLNQNGQTIPFERQ